MGAETFREAVVFVIFFSAALAGFAATLTVFETTAFPEEGVFFNVVVLAVLTAFFAEELDGFVTGEVFLAGFFEAFMGLVTVLAEPFLVACGLIAVLLDDFDFDAAGVFFATGFGAGFFKRVFLGAIFLVGAFLDAAFPACCFVAMRAGFFLTIDFVTGFFLAGVDFFLLMAVWDMRV